MTASKLIQRLQIMIIEHGDHEVYNESEYSVVDKLVYTERESEMVSEPGEPRYILR